MYSLWYFYEPVRGTEGTNAFLWRYCTSDKLLFLLIIIIILLKEYCIEILQLSYNITPITSCYIKALCNTTNIPRQMVCATERDFGPCYHSFHFCSLSHTYTPERPSPATLSGHRIHQRPPPLLEKRIKTLSD